MVLWIDGIYGVGKTSVIRELIKMTKKENITILSSDDCYQEMIQKNPLKAFGGTTPNNNNNFLKFFRREIEKRVENQNDIIVDMNVLTKEAKEILIDTIKDSVEFLHVILEVDSKVHEDRIKGQEGRDVKMAEWKREEGEKFLEKNYLDAIRIDTTDCDAISIAKKILHLVNW